MSTRGALAKMKTARTPSPKSGTLAAADRGVIRSVLIVDDSRAHLKLMSTILTRWGFEVAEAESGEAAMAHLKAHSVDLVLSDWVMPGMSGIELCERFRKEGGDAYVYFILLTSKSEVEDVARGLAAGADDFLSKPIDRNELQARIAAGERLIAMQRSVVEKNRLLEATLGQLQTLYDGIARDLIEARRLQQSLVPERFCSYPEGDVSLLLRPSGHVGGDLVGTIATDGDQIGLYSIDVSGHGIASALLTARLAGYFSGSTPAHNIALVPTEDGGHEIRSPEDICLGLNALTIGDMETELYFTMLFARCDLATGCIEIAQAGHPNPLIQRKGGSVEFLGNGGMPVGLFEEPIFGTFSTRVEPGDRLLFYSDGFTEQVDPEGEMLDEEGLEKIIRGLSETSGADFIEALTWHLSDYSGDADFDDDISAVFLEYKGRS
ncbi:MAG: SpoIIE family protein phosphatase [Pseudomonadota bacterium]